MEANLKDRIPDRHLDEYEDIELEITIKTPGHEEKFIFIEPEKLRNILWEDEGFLSEIVTAAVNRKNRKEVKDACKGKRTLYRDV